MGITQLLPFLEKASRPASISEFRGQAVAVDSYCWLHRGARGCALQLAMGESTDSYVTYCMRYVKMLLSYDIRPIMVFDGRILPAKADTEKRRRLVKQAANSEGRSYLRLGQMNEAYKCFSAAVDVTPQMALKLIKACRNIGVDCIVAPYESDAQLAFFCLKGIVQVVISEDSDLLVFGCPQVMYKMDTLGRGVLYEAEKIPFAIQMNLQMYNLEKFRHMCILSGCDYLDSLPGIGLKKALKFLCLTAETEPIRFIDKIRPYLNLRRLVIPDDYKFKFKMADATFKHQVVYDPLERRLVNLTPIEGEDGQYCGNVGVLFDEADAYQLALGNLNPSTMQSMDNWEPSREILSEFSIWSPQYKSRPRKHRAPLPSGDSAGGESTETDAPASPQGSTSSSDFTPMEVECVLMEVEGEVNLGPSSDEEARALAANKRKAVAGPSGCKQLTISDMFKKMRKE